MQCNLHKAHGVAMIGRKRRIVEAPVVQVVSARVDVPIAHVQIIRDLHPVTLSYYTNHMQCSVERERISQSVNQWPPRRVAALSECVYHLPS